MEKTGLVKPVQKNHCKTAQTNLKNLLKQMVDTLLNSFPAYCINKRTV